jgi:hypothetical protein
LTLVFLPALYMVAFGNEERPAPARLPGSR